MINPNTNHPDFDMLAEILCLMPRTPIVVSSKHVADDLGITYSLAGHLRERLLKRGCGQSVDLMTQTRGEWSVGRAAWPMVKAEAEAYYLKVYGDEA